MTELRISKYIASSGIASRRTADKLINAGQVRVNGSVVTDPVYFVQEGDVVTVNGRQVTPRTETEMYMFHKPINTMTTVRDPGGRKTIYDCLPLEYRNLKYIGRLDFRTTGLLLLTNDGELARQLTLPSSNIPRIYIAKISSKDLSGLDRARQGITIDGITYAPMEIIDIGNNRLRIKICEGKKNEIRVVLRECGCPVVKLHRVSYGKVKLGNLAVGKICKLSQKTIDEMLKTL